MTPRALGPIHDVARRLGGRIEQAFATGAPREDLFHALENELATGGPTMLVVEDAHWADEGTLDVFAFLGRRIAQLPVLLVVTSRPEGTGARHGLLAAFGEVGHGVTTRVELPPLSRAAVAELARAAGRPAEGLHEATGGNPFFVTEILAAGGDAVPRSVRDAVLARYGRLSHEARKAVELVSIVPGRVELGLAEALGIPHEVADECLAAGILVADEEALRFRHEIARRAVEGMLSPPRRLALERRLLGPLEEAQADVARLVHHARRGGVRDAVRRYAPLAARTAAAAGAHREAVEHYRAALGAADTLPPAERVELLEGLSVEAYLCDGVEEALEARRAAVAVREGLGDPRALGDGLRWLARLLWWAGASGEAEAVGRRAVRLVDGLAPGRELAMALSGLSQLRMLALSADEAIELGSRAMELARALDDTETTAHALTNVGIARLLRGEMDRGGAALDEAFALADARGLHDHAARALVAQARESVEHREPAAEQILDRAIAYAEEHELDGYRRYALGFRALRRLDRGAWKDGEIDAREAISGGGPGISSFPALVALGRFQTLRGEPAATATLDQVAALARRSGELLRIWPATVVRAEHAWLAGELAQVAEEVGQAYEHALAVSDPWMVGELAFWRWRAGALAHAPPAATEPYRLSIEATGRLPRTPGSGSVACTPARRLSRTEIRARCVRPWLSTNATRRSPPPTGFVCRQEA